MVSENPHSREENVPPVDYKTEILFILQQMQVMGVNDYEIPRINELLQEIETDPSVGPRALQEAQAMLDRKNPSGNG